MAELTWDKYGIYHTNITGIRVNPGKVTLFPSSGPGIEVCEPSLQMPGTPLNAKRAVARDRLHGAGCRIRKMLQQGNSTITI